MSKKTKRKIKINPVVQQLLERLEANKFYYNSKDFNFVVGKLKNRKFPQSILTT